MITNVTYLVFINLVVASVIHVGLSIVGMLHPKVRNVLPCLRTIWLRSCRCAFFLISPTISMSSPFLAIIATDLTFPALLMHLLRTVLTFCVTLPELLCLCRVISMMNFPGLAVAIRGSKP